MIAFYDACMLSEFLTNIVGILNKIVRISQAKNNLIILIISLDVQTAFIYNKKR